ncbi:phospholipase A1-like [Contarinia nasturtii]|uniref:phospholipase A1-like n=1 Tax=Contarinia nasturtii TaxID=265458 RepID=UPI0012D42D65|nr:phospholipase A1-like [Contarinia nasturtii]
MRIFALLLLAHAASGFLFFGNKCQSPFSSSPKKHFFAQLWGGLFRCDYDPDEDQSLISKVGLFVRYYYITSGQTTYSEVSELDMGQLINPNYTNYIILHGFADGVEPDEWMEAIAKKIVTDQDANVILMDYSAISNCNYIYMAKRVAFDLAEHLAKCINRWEMNLNNTTIIGHSLGGHIAGATGTFLTQMTGQKLARIFALDAAGPVYEVNQGLNSTCAQFVQALHTSKILGTSRRLGHSDFYANRDSAKQPGCFFDGCNHSRATELFYASCFKENKFIGIDCNGSGSQSQYGLYTDGKEGCYSMPTGKCFPFTLQT